MVKSSTKIIAGKGAKASPKVSNVTRASVSDGKTERSVDVRKIDNGYIVRESTYGPKGDYRSTEKFVEKPPVIQLAPTKAKK